MSRHDISDKKWAVIDPMLAKITAKQEATNARITDYYSMVSYGY